MRDSYATFENKIYISFISYSHTSFKNDNYTFFVNATYGFFFVFHLSMQKLPVNNDNNSI